MPSPIPRRAYTPARASATHVRVPYLFIVEDLNDLFERIGTGFSLIIFGLYCLWIIVQVDDMDNGFRPLEPPIIRQYAVVSLLGTNRNDDLHLQRIGTLTKEAFVSTRNASMPCPLARSFAQKGNAKWRDYACQVF